MYRAGPFLNPVQSLYHLASALLICSEEFEHPEGIKSSIEYFRHLRGFPLDSFSDPRIDATTSLIRALRTQVRLGAGNGLQDINEMVVLCIELLSSRQSAAILAEACSYLTEATEIEFNRRPTTEMIDEVIGCLREAVKAYPPDSYDAWHQVMYVLAYTLNLRFMKTHSKKDCEEADALLEKILEPGGCPDSFRDKASQLSALLAYMRSSFLREPEYSEVAIARLRAHFGSLPLDPDEQLRLTLASSIATQSTHRFTEFSLDESLEEANLYISQLVNASSSSSLPESAELLWWFEEVREIYSTTDIQQKIEYLENLLATTPPGTKYYIECLSRLEKWYESKFRRTDDILDIEEAIKYSRLALNATGAGDLQRIICLSSLRNLLNFAFNKTREISYLDESITISYDNLECKIFHFQVTEQLVLSLLTRERLLGRIEDLHEAIRLISVVINNEYGRESDRFKLACQWATIARSIRHPTPWLLTKPQCR
jgi:hypothetical protein